MSKNRTSKKNDGTSFEDFLRWKKENQTSKSSRRYAEEGSSSDSSVEEVKYAKRRVASKRYESDSASSSDEHVSPKKKQSRRLLDSRSDRGRRGGERRDRPKSGYPEKSRRQRDRSYSSSSDDENDRYRRNLEDSDSEDRRRVKRRSVKSTRVTDTRAPPRSRAKSTSYKSRNVRQYDSESSDDEVQRRATKGSARRKKPQTRRAANDSSEEVGNREKGKRGGRDDSSEDEAPKKGRRGHREEESSASEEDMRDEVKETKRKPKINKKGKAQKATSPTKPEEQAEPTPKPKKVAHINFDHVGWLDNWNKVYSNKELDSKKKRSKLKELLQVIDDSTSRACAGDTFTVVEKHDEEKKEKTVGLTTEALAPSVKGVALYAYHHLEKHFPKEKGTTKTTAHFIKNDILDVGLFIKKEVHRNPLVLVMGDPRTPGGKDHKSLFGVEASIWRRTALREFIDPERRRKYFTDEKEKDSFVYDIPQNGVVYCPNVPVFRSHAKKGFPFIPIEHLSFVVVPPLMSPAVEGGKMDEKDVEIIRKKITMIFLTALAHGHDAVVVTAFGCGFAKNPPEQVASIFSEVIGKFRNIFQNIAFAIIDDPRAIKNNPQGNIAPFSTVFDNLQKKKK